MFEFPEINMNLKKHDTHGYRYFITDRFGELFLKDIYQYYETPLLISLIDKSGMHYMAMCTHMEKGSKTWMIVCLTEQRLEEAITGRVELREIFEKSDSGAWMFEEREGERLCQLRGAELIDENLPDAGICLNLE